MARLEVVGLTKYYGTLRAVDDVTFTVEDAEIVALLGPSGCGKTTVLRIVAGLEEEYEGDVVLDSHDLRGVAPDQRDFGLMFQDLALFPHMNVGANVGFGLRMIGIPRDDQRRRIAELLELVGLPGSEKRSVFELSGGERQRVALARSLAPEPSLLMLDEPLGALDRSLRESLSVEIRDLLKGLGLSALYVTHDQEEALTIADRMVVMEAGHIRQIGTPTEILRRPASEFVARFMGYQNLFPAKAGAGGYEVGGHLLPAEVPASGPGLLLIPEDAIEISEAGPLSGTVETIQLRGRQIDAWVDAGGIWLHLVLSPARHAAVQTSQSVRLSIDTSLLHLIPPPA
jgi:ABC-type Fe3+/spermidine/putrescine transport system ATPase subunit